MSKHSDKYHRYEWTLKHEYLQTIRFSRPAVEVHINIVVGFTDTNMKIWTLLIVYVDQILFHIFLTLLNDSL